MWEKTREHDIMLENDGKVETCGKDFFFGGKIWGRRGKGMESEHGNHEE